MPPFTLPPATLSHSSLRGSLTVSGAAEQHPFCVVSERRAAAMKSTQRAGEVLILNVKLLRNEVAPKGAMRWTLLHLIRRIKLHAGALHVRRTLHERLQFCTVPAGVPPHQSLPRRRKGRELRFRLWGEKLRSLPCSSFPHRTRLRWASAGPLLGEAGGKKKEDRIKKK